jgi:hypothetical protein
MNSLTLKENGFADFLPLKALQITNIPNNKTCVLVLANSVVTNQPSDILYIGKSKSPSKRIFGGYLAGYGGKTTRKIHSILFNDNYLEKVSISWLLNDNPKIKQKELLENFKKEHGDYPAWNTPKKVAIKPKKAPKVIKPASSKKKAKSS